MKKSKLLVVGLAAAALGLAGAASGTVAWFTASNNAQITSVKVDEETLTAVTSTLKYGSFQLEAVLVNCDHSSLGLTDAEGKSWVYLSEGAKGEAGSNKTEATAANKVATYTIALKVVYTKSTEEGATTPSAADVKSIWLATIGSKAVTINVSQTGNVKFVGSAGPTGSEWVGTDSTSISIPTANLTALEFEAGSGAYADKFVSKTDAAADKNVFARIQGQEVIEDGTEAHTVTFTPVIPE